MAIGYPNCHSVYFYMVNSNHPNVVANFYNVIQNRWSVLVLGM